MTEGNFTGRAPIVFKKAASDKSEASLRGTQGSKLLIPPL